jgi:hypothetical protein
MVFRRRRCWSPDQQLTPKMSKPAKIIYTRFIKPRTTVFIIFRKIRELPFRMNWIVMYIFDFLQKDLLRIQANM